MKLGRNDKCPCDSGKKFKKCHLGTQLGKSIQGNYGQPYLDYVLYLMKGENNTFSTSKKGEDKDDDKK